MNKWKIGKPPKTGYYLIVTTGKEMLIAEYSTHCRKWIIYEDGGPTWYPQVSYWMELPDWPEGIEDE